jgi:hypothetical protein
LSREIVNNFANTNFALDLAALKGYAVGYPIKVANSMQSLEEYLETLKGQRRELEVRLASIDAAINAISLNQPAAAPQPTQPAAPQLQGPSLDNLRMRDAIRIYLAWREDNGLPPATLGELEKELARHNVVSFRNKAMASMVYGWKSLCNGLGSPNNMKMWNIERKDKEGHFTRADVITLSQPRNKSLVPEKGEEHEG